MPPVFPRNAAALLIGIGQYDRADGISPLPFAARDARSLAKVLIDPDVCGFPRERIALLTDAKAGRAAIDRHLSRWLPAQARGAELVVLYFAGHGVVESVAGREEGYLVPWDADPGDIARHGIAMSDVARWIDALEADAVVVCLDCCHAGGILPRDGVTLRGDRDMAIAPSVIQRLGGRGRFLLASCDRGQKSIESQEFRHGLFTHHLLRGLAGAGDRDGDGFVSIAELFAYVASAVSEDARTRYHREQTPWTSATYNGEVLLSAVRHKPKTLSPPSTRPSIAPEPTTTEEAESIARLRRLRKQPDHAELPFVFRHLAHRVEAVRRQAHKALSAIPWEQVCWAVEDLARRGAESVGDVLDGLAALETHARVIALLDRLASVLQGAMRDRAVWLLDRKRLAADRDRVAEVFRASHGGEILRVLGPGTYTGAYLARLEGTGLEVVVRVLRPEFAAQPMVRAHFVALGVKAVRLVHHNLVLTRDARAFADRGLYFTVRDYVEGATLREVLASGRRFDPMQSCKILRQILEALTPLHRDGLYHGGIKPSNVFLTRDDRVVLGEPSLPIPASGYDLPRLAYDFRYAPPELFRGPNQAGPASDFYALGCVAHELFRGTPPFVSDNHYELIARHDRDPIPAGDASERPGVHGWLRTALAKAASSRFADIDAARVALTRLENDLREPPAEGRPRRATESLAAKASGIISDPPSSVHLMREQSLMDLADRQSLVPLTGAPGQSIDPEATGGVRPAVPSSARIDIPGYRFVRVLGQGGMGVVFEAIQESLERPVAIKIISHSYASEEARRRFLTEARALAAVPHPNIVGVYDFGDRDGSPYLVMEYCPGGSLSQRLGGTPMSPQTAAALMGQVVTGVAAAHAAGILHRDLKPANILFSADGTPKITDFGLARLTERTTHDTLAGAVMGTPSYMSPEQAQGHADLGPTTDVYSLGATLYECLTGRPPFRSESVMDTLMKVMSEDPVPPRQLVPNVSRDLEAICLRCLRKDPARRYAGAEELAADLERFVAEPATRTKRRWWPFG